MIINIVRKNKMSVYILVDENIGTMFDNGGNCGGDCKTCPFKNPDSAQEPKKTEKEKPPPTKETNTLIL